MIRGLSNDSFKGPTSRTKILTRSYSHNLPEIEGPLDGSGLWYSEMFQIDSMNSEHQPKIDLMVSQQYTNHHDTPKVPETVQRGDIARLHDIFLNWWKQANWLQQHRKKRSAVYIFEQLENLMTHWKCNPSEHHRPYLWRHAADPFSVRDQTYESPFHPCGCLPTYVSSNFLWLLSLIWWNLRNLTWS